MDRHKYNDTLVVIRIISGRFHGIQYALTDGQ